MTRILVVDDDRPQAEEFGVLLRQAGCAVTLASNGREALTLAEQGGFDLLLLDVHMPELDGFQVVQAVRERELTAGGHLPIIALTARMTLLRISCLFMPALLRRNAAPNGPIAAPKSRHPMPDPRPRSRSRRPS